MKNKSVSRKNTNKNTKKINHMVKHNTEISNYILSEVIDDDTYTHFNFV